MKVGDRIRHARNASTFNTHIVVDVDGNTVRLGCTVDLYDWRIKKDYNVVDVPATCLLCIGYTGDYP